MIIGKAIPRPKEKLDNGTTAGQLIYWDGSKWTYADETKIFWDNTNGFLGVGDMTPNNPIDIERNQNNPTVFEISNIDNSANSAAGGYFRTANSTGLFISVDANWTGLDLFGFNSSYLAQSFAVMSLDSVLNFGTIAAKDINFYPYFSNGENLALSIKSDGRVKTGSGVIGKITTVTDTYTVLVSDETVVCSKATAFTVTLPVAAEATVGQKFTIKNIGAGVVTIDGDSTDTIDGQQTQTLNQWESMQLQCYAANAWGIM